MIGEFTRVELVPVRALFPDPRNPRQHSYSQIKKIARSIKNFGFNVPILINRDNLVLAGHGRLGAAIQLGLTEVPVIRLEHLSAAQARAFAIADNRLAELATWDDRQLGELLHELSIQEPNLDITDIGFEVAESDLLIANASAATEKPDTADKVPEPTNSVAVTRLGDLWLLGSHRVLCGSALEPAAYDTLMHGQKAAVVFTDPPYNVPINGHVSGNGKAEHREFAMGIGELSPREFIAFLTTTCRLHAMHSLNGSIHFWCMDWAHTGALLSAGEAAYSELKNICAWVKNNGGMGSLYRGQHEFVLVFKSGTAPHRNNIELGRHGRNRTNVWSYPGAATFSRSSDEGYLLGLHPTVKPVRMVADALLDCSARADVVLDGFLGSGTTVIAAERTGRCCFGLELDPLYLDVIVRRWQNYTGDAAIHAVTGKTFAEHEEVGQ